MSFSLFVAYQGTGQNWQLHVPEKVAESSADPIRLACQDFFTIQSAHQNDNEFHPRSPKSLQLDNTAKMGRVRTKVCLIVPVHRQKT